MAGTGKIVGGAIILLIGIIIAGWGLTINNIQSNNIQNCNSFIGHLSQSLNSEQAEICSKAPMYQGFSNAAIVGGLVFAGIGGLLIYIGATAEKKNKKERAEYTPSARDQYHDRRSRNERVYCRYCGEQRDISGTFCSRCGRSSQSATPSMKSCQKCTILMGEDSQFCGNCGQRF
jgi:Double zinc ribbon